MSTSGVRGLTAEQTREINALLDGNQLSSESISLLQGLIVSQDPILCEQVLDQVNDKQIDFGLKMSSTDNLNLSSKSLSRISPQLLAFLQKNNLTLKTIDFSNNILVSLDAICQLSLPNLRVLAIGNNHFPKKETDKVIASFPHAQVNTDVESEVILSAPLRPKVHTPHYAKTQSVEQREPIQPNADPRPSKLGGFFKKLFK